MSPITSHRTSSHGSNPSSQKTGKDGRGTKPGDLRILIVEDEFLIALELENRLLDAGYKVVGIAVTATEAVAMARAEQPDLAIMDIRLAGRTDGVEAAIELFGTFGVRSVFASAHADAETRKRAAPARPIGWVQKPYSAEALIRLIRDFCG